MFGVSIFDTVYFAVKPVDMFELTVQSGFQSVAPFLSHHVTVAFVDIP